jgi:predicted site-specific integrase-resolvase
MRHNSPNSTNREITPEYLDVREAEAMSGLSRWTWRKYAYKGKIASVKAGKRLLIPISEIRRVMAEGYRPAV